MPHFCLKPWSLPLYKKRLFFTSKIGPILQHFYKIALKTLKKKCFQGISCFLGLQNPLIFGMLLCQFTESSKLRFLRKMTSIIQLFKPIIANWTLKFLKTYPKMDLFLGPFFVFSHFLGSKATAKTLESEKYEIFDLFRSIFLQLNCIYIGNYL